MQQQKVRLATRATIMMLVDGMFSGKVYKVYKNWRLQRSTLVLRTIKLDVKRSG